MDTPIVDYPGIEGNFQKTDRRLRFFLHLHGKEKSAAISKLAYFSQKRVRSYIVIVLVTSLKNFQNICKIMVAAKTEFF